MNIEEAIKNLKVLIGLEEFNKLSYKENNAIETLLTAYEKEKETSHYIQSQLDIANAKLVEEKEKNRKVSQNFAKIVATDYISKDKIKAKIEEYEQDVKDFEEYWSKDPRKFKKEKSVDYYKLEALKELLEKE